MAAPNLHRRLTEIGRFSAAEPWLVTHALRLPDGGVDFYGLACDEIPRNLAHLEGLELVVELGAPHRLGPGDLDRERARYVPVFDDLAALRSPSQRLIELATYLLEGLPAALEKDIPGAKLVVRVVAG